MGNVPQEMKDGLTWRDEATLGEGELVRYQWGGIGPGMEVDLRLLIREDGEFSLSRRGKEGEDRTGSLPETVIDEIRAALDDEGFFDEEPYVEDTDVRGGSFAIVTARSEGGEHEVWYVNVENSLTSLLHEVVDGAGEEGTWTDVLEEQLALKRRLEER